MSFERERENGRAPARLRGALRIPVVSFRCLPSAKASEVFTATSQVKSTIPAQFGGLTARIEVFSLPLTTRGLLGMLVSGIGRRVEALEIVMISDDRSEGSGEGQERGNGLLFAWVYPDLSGGGGSLTGPT